MTDKQIIPIPPGGSAAFHSAHVNPQVEPTPGAHHATGGAGAQKFSDNIQVVEFLLEDEHFAIDLFEVREVVEYTRITHLPDTPPHIRGIIDLRGEITTIIDPKKLIHIHGEKKQTRSLPVSSSSTI